MKLKLWLKSSLKFSLVTLGIIVLTSFSIDATDTLKGSQTALSILTERFISEKCPGEMVLIQGSDGYFCVDKYEASPGTKCIVTNPQSVSDTAHNIADTRCVAESVEGAGPWVFVAQPQAAQLCAKTGKRLPTGLEWYEAAAGTPDNLDTCNLSGTINKTGLNGDCRSGLGVFDAVGNVWELTSDEIVDGVFNGQAVPVEGFVERVGLNGVAVETATTPNDIYNQDYFWSKSEGRFAIMRGGFYGSKHDGGIYSVHGATDANFASAAIGFRCVKSLN